MSKDKIIFDLIKEEKNRQIEGVELIASENFTSDNVMKATGSVLTNKYAEGYPGKRYYGGCQVVDKIELLAIERAKELFGACWANVQPHSGSQANSAVFFACLNVGDKILGFDLSHGGHLTHGSSVNFSGKLYNPVFYGVDKDTGILDYDKMNNDPAIGGWYYDDNSSLQNDCNCLNGMDYETWDDQFWTENLVPSILEEFCLDSERISPTNKEIVIPNCTAPTKMSITFSTYGTYT